MPQALFFPYFGPNRRADVRVVEIGLDFGPDDSNGFPQYVSDIRQILDDARILDAGDGFPDEQLPGERMAWYSALLAQTALLFQRKNGHRVEYFSVSCKPELNRCTVLVEHEHSKVGMAAVKLAAELFSGKADEFAQAYRSFSDFARASVLPLETEAIISAARRCDIPFFQFEREPLSDHFNSRFRRRPNASLHIGHGANCHVLDGVFCVDRADDYLKAMLRNPEQRKDLLRQSKIPVVQAGEGNVTGNRQFYLLVINGWVTAVEQLAGGGMQVVAGLHESLADMSRVISEKVGFSPIAINLKAAELSLPLADSGGTVQDFDLAPDLGYLLGLCEGGSDLLEVAADNLIDWLFPDPGAARMPVVAVTGTNGKTTTCRMISHIMQNTGRKPGLVCTDGIYVDGEQISDQDASTFLGHARVLTHKQVDVAVLEAHHRGIAIRGFAFDHCDVAVCLNVTKEHLQAGEIETVEQMADIKRALLERAGKAAVLYADDSNCVAMIDFIKAEIICLVSLQSDVGQLRMLAPQQTACFCVLESMRAEEWIVLYDAQQRLPVMPVRHIPATIDGTARFNISNAMHAIAASYLVGIDLGKTKTAMANFTSGFESTPGRLNLFDDLTYRVVMDYAHNADGFRKLLGFVDSQPVTGRKILMISYEGDRLDEDIKEAVSELAGHFDHYVCRNFEFVRGREIREIPTLLKAGLLSAGVAGSAISIVPEADKAVRHSLAMAAPGDLVVLLVGETEFQSVWALLGQMAAASG